MSMNQRTCFAALLFVAFAAQPVFAAQEMLLRERCHQGECTFTKIIQTKTIGKNDGGYLLEVKARSVVVWAPKGGGEPEKVPEAGSFGLVRVSYAYCSTQKSAVIFYDSRKFYAHLLNIGEAPAGYEIDSHIEYWAACHNKIVGVGELTDGKLAKDAADLGYGKFPDDWGRQREFRNKKKAFQYFGF
jgi:hypothetical protein